MDMKGSAGCVYKQTTSLLILSSWQYWLFLSCLFRPPAWRNEAASFPPMLPLFVTGPNYYLCVHCIYFGACVRWSSCMYFPARVWMRFWHNRLSRITTHADKGDKQWLRSAGDTNNAGCFAQMAPLTRRKRQRKQNTGGPDSTVFPCKEDALVGPDWVDTKSRKPRRQPGVIQGRGSRRNPALHTSATPTSLQMHGNIWSPHSDVFNYNHMHQNTRLPLSECHRIPHHLLVQSAKWGLLTFHCSASTQWGQ